ncbi:ABC-type nitrate/sulfonate/bicarbonate transp ort system, permease component SsuC [Peptoclostridium acidaminophilum DSM 3953]|uniref:ABC-type nitrate/sulfonate/bicarbonate transp ort system, permease component SsuC n=1 Tax=Peptoclostridium acidaminophilum DSM 3953 TaxID=1286171 RepID=W8T4H0_PEPAC|nr:ABC transporter permease [Peptoclostridium acidaminophilum]AHM55725.1 ABC-type nitrate/sulfonate/bicarbonate transp ort system, permease component SsuC [Peptoclostridium acidaminophilum DSM 3953]
MEKNKSMNGLYLPVFIIFAWWALSSLGLTNEYIMPSPEKVVKTSSNLISSGMLQKHLLVSLARVLVGFVVAFAAAFPLAVFCGLSSKFEEFFKPTLEFIRHVPPMALIPMLILWFGIGEVSKLSIIFLATFFPIYLNTLSGIREADVKLIQVGEVFGFSRSKIFFWIILPQAIPSILVGMQIGLGYSWRALIGAELIAASSGIGYMIIDAEQLSRPDIIIIGIMAIGIAGYAIDALFMEATRRITRWSGGEQHHGESDDKKCS